MFIHFHSFSFMFIHVHSFPFMFIHVHLFLFIFIHDHLFSFIFIHVHSFSFMFINFHSFSFMIIHVLLFSFIFIHVHSFPSMFIHFHSSSFIFIHFHSCSFIFILSFFSFIFIFSISIHSCSFIARTALPMMSAIQKHPKVLIHFFHNEKHSFMAKNTVIYSVFLTNVKKHWYLRFIVSAITKRRKSVRKRCGTAKKRCCKPKNHFFHFSLADFGRARSRTGCFLKASVTTYQKQEVLAEKWDMFIHFIFIHF